jgi:MoaA/NifB/PqqE/SkfB family radical SAM enzyme
MRFSDFIRRTPKWTTAERLDAVVAPGIPKGECAQFLDAFQAETYQRLVARYGDQTFAMLLALKLSNLAAGRYHYASRHSILFSHPVMLMVDPANACQLGCPGCIHTTNESYRARFDWPRKTLSLETYRAFLDRFGPFAFSVALYNYGEPLLNKQFAEIVRSSKAYLLHTFTSTNLSMPIDSAESIVESGLDYMTLSIDGATQPVYERYRRKGDLALVLENARKLAAAKRALGSATPRLVWQFLTFEHNYHELGEARRLAAEIGVNEFSVATPFGVDSDDPSIRPVRSPDEGTHAVRVDQINDHRIPLNRTHERADIIQEAFRKSWQMRLEETGPDSAAPHSHTCKWLYFNLTMDGAARMMPCCMAPETDVRNLVFANFEPFEDRSALSLVNSSMARLARESFADRKLFDKDTALEPSSQLPFCAKCEEKPPPPYSMHNVKGDLRTLDPKRVVSDELLSKLTAWA